MPNSIDAEASEFAEAQDQLFDLWSSLILRTERHLGDLHVKLKEIDSSDASQTLRFLGSLSIFASQVFDVYVEKCTMQKQIEENEEDYEEYAEADHEQYRDRLLSIAVLGRMKIETSLNNLLQRFETRLDTIKKKTWHDFFDQINWLILISGYLISDPFEGERPIVPQAISIASVVSLNILNMFSGEGGAKVLDYILNLIKINMNQWIANEDVILQIVKVLKAFGKNPGARQALLKS
ncbi:Exportin-4, partial [Nowakowskiella sp. JEL0078]